MQYKIKNVCSDMKLLRDGKMFIIKKNKEFTVSAEEYQYLSKVYGFDVKGEKEIIVQVTEPVTFTKMESESNKPRRKHKRS